MVETQCTVTIPARIIVTTLNRVYRIMQCLTPTGKPRFQHIHGHYGVSMRLMAGDRLGYTKLAVKQCGKGVQPLRGLDGLQQQLLVMVAER